MKRSFGTSAATAGMLGGITGGVTQAYATMGMSTYAISIHLSPYPIRRV